MSPLLPLGQIPAPSRVTDVWWPIGALQPSVLPPEEKEPDGWLLADGRRPLKADYAALFAAIGHAFEGGTDPGDGRFKIPPLVEGSGSPARVPLGKGEKALGVTGGSLGAKHGPGTLTYPSHAHNSAFAVGDHAHGYSLSAIHLHLLYNDAQRCYTAMDGDVTAALQHQLYPDQNPYFNVTTWTDPGVAGAIHGAGALGVPGVCAANGPFALAGETEAEEPPYTTVYWYVKT